MNTLSEFRKTLRDQGMPPNEAMRCVEELEDHLTDLQAEALASGLSSDEAGQLAWRKLGNVKELALALVDSRRQSEWWGRHPIFGFGFLPVFMLSGLLLSLVIIGAFTGSALGLWEPQRLTESQRMGIFFLIKLVYFSLLFGLPIWFGIQAQRSCYGFIPVFSATIVLVCHGIFHQITYQESLFAEKGSLVWSSALHWDFWAVFCPIGGFIFYMICSHFNQLKSLALIILLFVVNSVQAGEALPSSEELVNKLLKRAESVARETTNKYTYEKQSLMEELDSAGKVTKSTEKIYEVVFFSGMPFSRLVKIQGQPLNAAEIEKQNQREQEFRKKVTSIDVKQLSDRKESWITKALLDKFQFLVQAREIYQGRTTLLVKFQPKEVKLPAKTVQDRVLNRLKGVIWVDEGDAEIVKCNIQLTENVYMGLFGVIGALNQFDLMVERIRMPNGVWVIGKQTMQISGRQLFMNIRNRTTEKSSHFKQQE